MTPQRRRSRATVASAAVKLVEALRRGRYSDGTRAAEVLALALERDGDACGAEAIRSASNGPSGSHTMRPLPSADDSGDWREPTQTLDPLVLDDEQAVAFDNLIVELEAAPDFIAAGIDAPTRVFFHGASGTGKTLAAAHIASRLGVPLLVGRLDRIVGSLMGETAKKMAALFSAAATTPSVVFLDEIDGVIGSRGRRGSAAEAESARSTSALLQQLDMLPPEQIVIAASNFPGEIDDALYRRFPTRLAFSAPGLRARQDMLRRWWQRLPLSSVEDRVHEVAAQTAGLSGAELRARAMEEGRRVILNSRRNAL